MRWVRWTLLVQLVFFLGWAGWQEWRKAGADEIVLATVPVDPRDLWSGYYMTLRYEISRAPCHDAGASSGTRVEVQLVPDRRVELEGRSRTVWKAAQCVFVDAATEDRMDGPTSRWVTGTWVDGGVQYGIEKYFFSEARKKAMNHVRSGRFFVRAAVGNDRRLVLKGLILPEGEDEAFPPVSALTPTPSATPTPVPAPPAVRKPPPTPVPVVEEPMGTSSEGAVKVYRVPARKKK